MGRHYFGDINGKFWFAVQSSDDALFFGGQEIEPAYLQYYFDEADLPDVKKGVAKCKDELGEHEATLGDFFKAPRTYNDSSVAKKLGVTVEAVTSLLKWYARLQLGKKIQKCLEEQATCEFEAEL